MSHVTTIKTVPIKDISALTKAVANLQAKGVKCELIQNAKPRVHGADSAPKCEYVLKLDGPYDVGFKLQKDGSYSTVMDTYQNHVGKRIGASCPLPSTQEGRTQHQMGQLFQEYTKEATINAAITSGYMVESATTDAEGNVHLTLAGM